MFNSLKYAKILEEAGLTQKEAETTINVLIEVMENKLATQEDLKELGAEFKEFRILTQNNIKEFKTEMQNEFKEFKIESRNNLKNLEYYENA